MDMGVGISIRSSTLLLVFCCILLCSNAENAKRRQQQLKSAMVVGTVYCDTCFRQQLSKASHFISGASVAVECIDGTTRTGFRREVKTNRHGVFRVRLPLKISKDADNIKACSVKLVRSNEPFCAVASSATSAGLHLKSKRNGLHVFSAGFFTFKPLKRPELCHPEPKPAGSAKSVSFANQKQAQPAMSFPPVPFLPSPELPLPPAPFLPSPGLPLPPVPLVPPPSLLPPIIPSPPGPVIPPIIPSPPPSLLPPVPNLPPVPVPLLTPPPPPPASIFPPFPIPFPPNPFFPGNPPQPAETSP